MVNKTGSSPQEFQPSETIQETTVEWCQCSAKWSHHCLADSLSTRKGQCHDFRLAIS